MYYLEERFSFPQKLRKGIDLIVNEISEDYISAFEDETYNFIFIL